MKLYITAQAVNPRRVEVYLAEKGIEVPMQQISILKGEHKQEAYRKLSPLAQVPVLVLDDGDCITESLAICRYFEELHPEPPFFGTDAKSRALVEMWIRRIELMMMIPTAMAFRHQHPAMKALETQIPEWGKLCHGRAEKMYHWLDKAIEGREFIAGDDYTMADIIAMTTIDFGQIARLKIPETCKNLAAWHGRVSARPSAKVGL